MVLADDELRFLEVNRAFERFLGYKTGELLGRSVESVSVPEDMARNLDIRQASTSKGLPSYELQKRYVRKDGGEAIAMVTAVRLGGFGESEVTVAFVRDLADEIKGHRALEELVRTKDEFLATIAHELRTPLTVVHGMSYELRDNWGGFEPEERRELAGLVADQSSELTYLVEDLLVAARADAGMLVVKDEQVELLGEVKVAIGSVPQSGQRVYVSGGFVAALADRLRVRQIVRNLLTNASRYGGAVAEVVIQDGTLPSIQVRDNGSGVPDELVQRIFEPYGRAHSRGIATEAVGLGLTVSRTLAESMGGSLEYRHEGGWSVFELTLKAADDSAIGRPRTSGSGLH